MRRLRRWWAEIQLARVDARVAAWYIDDGQLSTEPLDRPLSEIGRELRQQRLDAVRRLERAAGRDPAPQLLLPPTDAQRRAHARAAELRALLREWQSYTGLRDRAFDPALNPDDDEYAAGRSLIERTDAAVGRSW